MENGIFPGIACNLDGNMLAAAIPLFEEGRVAAIEWSFDALHKVKELPPWFDELLSVYSGAGRLVGHGIFFSVFSARWKPEQAAWLQQLRQLSARYRFDHVTEHFGFMTGADFHSGAPLSVPYTSVSLRIGRDRLLRIQEACNCPVGLENLAFSYSLEEVKRHGQFLDELLEPVNGFIILDLHNLYCQLHNFELDFETLIRLYPLHRVREIHISGGSWESAAAAPGEAVRRDTHDDRVPASVFELLEKTLPLCPQLKYVMLEQIGTGLHTPESRAGFGDDFFTMEAVTQRFRKLEPFRDDAFRSPGKAPAAQPPEDDALYRQQQELSAILETAGSYEEAAGRLQRSSLKDTAWNIDEWKPFMLETALQIAQKWKKR